MKALIGHTGFVGSNLASMGKYDGHFNSANSLEMRGRHFSQVVCAGVRAVKWKANNDPASDWAGILSLTDILETIKTDYFVLISTVDVYQSPTDVDEDIAADLDGAPYGANRAKLERFVADRFPRHLIVRLPALYGKNLKKNAIFDLLHDNMVHAIDPRACFQWYDVRRLEKDLHAVAGAGLSLMNIAVEPVPMSLIGERFFPGKLRAPDPSVTPARYDMHTRHAGVLGGQGRYHFSRDQVLDNLGNYLQECE